MNLELITAPAVEPITLAEAKTFLGVNFVEADAQITSAIAAARIYCENYQNRAYITQTRELYLPGFIADEIEIPLGKLQSIVSIKYKNSVGTETTLTNNTDYIYSTKGLIGKVTTPYGVGWPSFVPWPIDAVTIRFICGYGLAVAVPENIKHAIKYLVKHFFDNRNTVEIGSSVSEEVAMTVHDILRQERLTPY